MRAMCGKVLLAGVFLVLLLWGASSSGAASDRGFQENSHRENDCGIHALSRLLIDAGRSNSVPRLAQLLQPSARGLNIEALRSAAAEVGYPLVAVRTSLSNLARIELPVIALLEDRRMAPHTGHFLLLVQIGENTVDLYDPQNRAGERLSHSELQPFWQGIALIPDMHGVVPGKILSAAEARQRFGGTDFRADVQRSEGSSGEPGGDQCLGPGCNDCGNGRPVWSVNMVNFNLYIKDIPLWYTPALGPSLAVRLSYNTAVPITGLEPFGNKWQFNYTSYLEINTSTGAVTAVMPDGRRDAYVPDGNGGYRNAYGTFNTLSKISDSHYELRTPLDRVFVYQKLADSGYNISKSLASPTIGSSKHCLTEVRDPHGHALLFDYDDRGEIAAITDALGRITRITYTAGRITRIEDPFGRVALFEYDDGGNLSQITDMGGYTTHLRYDENAYIEAIENERGATGFNFEYGGISNLDYPAPGEPMGASYRITVTDPLGHKSEFYYAGKLGRGFYVGPRSYTEYVDERRNNFVASVPKTNYYYEDTARGKRAEIKSIIYPEGTATHYSRDYNTGLITSVADADGNQTDFTYNDRGFVTSVQPPIGVKKSFEYDPENHVDLTRVVVPGLGSIEMLYNDKHQITFIDDLAGLQTEITYNAQGKPQALTQHLQDHDISTRYEYYNSGETGAHRVKKVRRAGQTVAQYTYDVLGRVQTESDAEGITRTFEYDDLNHITRILYPDGKDQRYTYSGCCPHRVDSVTDRSGNTVYYSYDPTERLQQVLDSSRGQMNFDYDPDGNLTLLVDYKQNETRFVYDLENRLLQKTYADGSFVEYDYNRLGLVRRRYDSRRVWTNYLYDANHNPVSIYYSDGTSKVSYGYDDYGRLISMTDGTGTTTYTYEADSKIKTVDGPWADDGVTFAYDLLRRTTGVTIQSGQTVSYGYDDLNRLQTVQNAAGAFDYDYLGAGGLVERLSRPDGSYTAYAYDDPLKRLTQAAHFDSAAEILQSYTYTYTDPDHPDLRSTETVENAAPIVFSQNEFVAYDHNAVNQLIRSTPPERLYQYDRAGNLIRGYTPGGETFTADYDAENRLQSLEYTDAESGVIHRREYVYRADHMLAEIKRFEDGSLVEHIRIVRAEFLALRVRKGGNHYSYLYDGKGNVAALLDDTQAVAAAYRYDAFGNLKAKSGTVDQPYLFSTKRYDIDTGLVYFGYRYYAPVIGKWITRDPIWEKGGINLYLFALNNSIMYYDDNGLEVISPEMIKEYLPDISWKYSECRVGGSIVFSDYSSVIHNSGDGLLNSNDPYTDLSVTFPTVVGGGVQFVFQSNEEVWEESWFGESTLNFGVGEYFGISYNPKKGKISGNIGLGWPPYPSISYPVGKASPVF